MNRTEAPSAEVGERIFKGIPHPIRVYKVIQEPDSELARHLAQGVTLSDGVPQFAGIRLQAPQLPPAAGKPSRCRRTVLVSISLLLLSALVVYLMPSTEEMALEKTQQLLAEGNPADALVIAHKVLADNPDNKALKALAIEAARAQLDSLAAMGDIKAARGWLHRQLEVKPYLEPLRSEDMRLEAYSAINTVLAEPRYATDYQPEPLRQFLAHFAGSAEAPMLAAGLLEGKKVSRHTRLWLMRTALERGHEPDDTFYRFLTSQLVTGKIDYLLFESVREELLKYYPEQSRGWAETALEESNVLAFMNGWALLKGAGSGKLEDPYYQGLHRLINTADVMRLEQSRAVLSMQSERSRQTQIVAFLTKLVDSYPKFINSTILRDEVTRLRDGLKRSWSL
jgi:hypothetical protein